MKKFAAMLFSFLLVAFLATAFNSPGKKEVVKDVGYSLTIDQNTNQMIAVSPVMDYQIVRGVSVPYRGLTNEMTLITFNQISPVCRIDNYRQFSQESISTKLNHPAKGVNLFACDLGTWERYSKINIA
jgi:hypothetical protein